MKADLIIKNGNLFSSKKGNSIAVKDGKIIAIGATADMHKYIGEATKSIDAEGNDVIPAFIDSHIHASSCTELYKTKLMYGFDRNPEESRQDYIDRMMAEIKQYCDENPEAPIIRVVGWNPAEFQMDPEGEPSRYDLDKICSDRPLTMRSYDHHTLLINSRTLEMGGIDKDTADPSGGMMRDEEGNPTGTFKEMQAINIVFDNVECADFSVEEYKEGILAFQEQYAGSNGIMGIFDAYATDNAIKAYMELAQDGLLKIRVRTAWLADPAKDDTQFDKMISQKGIYDVGEQFKITTVKFFCDTGAFGFYMNKPFEKGVLEKNGLPEDYRGSSQWSDERLQRIFLKLSEAGFQIHVHCMGDAAVKQILDGFEYVEKQGVKGNRNAIAHISNIDESDMKRMAELNVIASMQPSWPIYDWFSENFTIPLLGRSRTLGQYPMGRIHKNGVVIASGTDFPVMTLLNPFTGIQIGATRKNPETAPGYAMYKDIVCGPEGRETQDCMSLEDMLDSYTISGAYEMFAEHITGSIECGKSADLLVLDRNLGNSDIMKTEFTKINYRIYKGEQI